jgi:sulfoxide reductase catalytic subunit YedY
MLIKTPRPWEIPEREATLEEDYLDRRRFLRVAGLAGASLLAGCTVGGRSPSVANGGAADEPTPPSPYAEFFPARRNPGYTLDRPLSDERVVTSYNNFYEFGEDKESPARLAHRLTLHPWTVQVAGLVGRPGTFDVEELMRSLPLEERLYRHRCVEAWAMAVPWTGFTVRSLLDLVEPLSSARHVRLVSFHRPREAPGQSSSRYPFPYYEGLSMEEAVNELAFFATGLYGRPLPPQNGAPIRLVVPWKYGFKSIKSIVRVELVAERPPTFWNDLQPGEYDFTANVDPSVPHPRWSQASERMIGTNERRPTRLFNGYEEQVARLYG